MIQYISKIQRAFIDQHGFAEHLDRPDIPVNVPDGEYPIVIDGRLDMVEIKGGLVGCCNFDTIPNLRAQLAALCVKTSDEREELLARIRGADREIAGRAQETADAEMALAATVRMHDKLQADLTDLLARRNALQTLYSRLVREALPMEATCAMVDGLARQIVMWWGFGRPTGKALYEHLQCGGTKYPEWLKTDIPDIDHVPPKGCVAAVLWRVMAEAYVASVKEQK